MSDIAVDLRAPLRTFVLAIPGLSASLSDFANGKAFFTRRPAPKGAEYPMGFVSPVLDTDLSRAHLDADIPELQYLLGFYGSNESPETYDVVENLATLAANGCNRPEPTSFEMPSGWKLIQMRAGGPRPAPVDDDKLVGRVVPLRLMVKPG